METAKCQKGRGEYFSLFAFNQRGKDYHFQRFSLKTGRSKVNLDDFDGEKLPSKMLNIHPYKKLNIKCQDQISKLSKMSKISKMSA